MKTNKKKIKSKRKTIKNTHTRPQIYDYIILGGGIAGLYTIYKLSIQYPNKTFLLLEKTDRFGGRVYSVPLHPTNDPGYILEAGAGRFSQQHPNLLKLIQEFGLSSKIQNASANAEYYPIEKNNKHPSEDNNESIFSQTYQLVEESLIGESKLSKLIANVIISSKIESREYLQKRNFLSYAKMILTSEEINHIESSFGYYSELVMMNAYDAIQLMQQLSPTNKFHVLSGGLSQIIGSLVERIKKNSNATLSLHQEVQTIRPNPKSPTTEYTIKTKTDSFLAKNVICALPKNILETLSIFQPIYKTLLSKILCGKLCRIYARFHPTEEMWFKDLPKITTNNNLRMIIPMNPKKGLIMISYSDNKYADFWYKLYQKHPNNQKPLIEELRKEIRQTTGKTIPEPMEIRVFYWPCGVGYWSIGANSQEISRKMIQPLTKYPNIYCCGEHFSEKNQQWMEGALETSQKVIDRINTK
jgi:monoamine oxidase